METKANAAKSVANRRELPIIQNQLQRHGKNLKQDSCGFDGYDAELLMNETKELREIITKRGTLEILIPLCCTTNPVRYIKFRNSLKGFSSKTLAIRLKQLERNEILERRAYKEIPPRVEYRLTNKGQELVESVVDLLQWMRKWSRSNSKKVGL
ncbi:MAG: helix-turn-helix domain-containing protein [Nitrososphaeraceae archaeon]|jgi:DNA-binding HxlR family transcriptional regulator